jgi:hypothetical protein
MFPPYVVKPTGHLKGRIGQALFGVAQRVLDDPAALHPCQGVLDADPDLCQLAVERLFLFR